MYCKHCGNKLEDSAKYCDVCGRPTAEFDGRSVNYSHRGNERTGGFRDTLIDWLSKSSDFLGSLMDKLIDMKSTGILIMVAVMLFTTVLAGLAGSVVFGSNALVFAIILGLLGLGISYLYNRFIIKFTLDKVSADYTDEELRVGTLMTMVFQSVVKWIFGNSGFTSLISNYNGNGAINRNYFISSNSLLSNIITLIMIVFFVTALFFHTFKSDDDALSFGGWYAVLRIVVVIVLTIIASILLIAVGAYLYSLMTNF